MHAQTHMHTRMHSRTHADTHIMRLTWPACHSHHTSWRVAEVSVDQVAWQQALPLAGNLHLYQLQCVHNNFSKKERKKHTIQHPLLFFALTQKVYLNNLAIIYDNDNFLYVHLNYILNQPFGGVGSSDYI